MRYNYRLSIRPAIEKTTLELVCDFESAAEMVAAKDTAASLLLFLQDSANVMKDYSNFFLMEACGDSGWVVYDEEEYEGHISGNTLLRRLEALKGVLK
jgi:hypothetical protein